MNNPKKIWKNARKIIPGGNGLLSKRPDRYSPDNWPTYYKSSNGVFVTDLKGKKYMDMAEMGMGTCVLGYANKYVDNIVKRNISNGVNSTLNSVEEFDLAKKILKFDKFADQVKFTRAGGEAMALAIRVARAETKKEKILFSGYHGWHDWYLAANILDKTNLNKHLLVGLDPLGVPKNLVNTSVGFEYNNSSELKKISKRNVAAIVIEGCRYSYPNKEFIKTINDVCKKNNICLIIDEITSGWRIEPGGVYKKLKIKPDIVVYGKALGNGYAIAAVVGKKKYLSNAEESFMSSTAWTERVGFAAASGLIDFFVKNKVHNHINSLGKKVLYGWEKIANKYGIKLTTSKIPHLCTFFLHYKNNESLYTYFTNEMLRKNILASNRIYLSFSHKDVHIKKYLNECDKIFKEMKRKIDKGYNFKSFKSRYEGFKRLTK